MTETKPETEEEVAEDEDLIPEDQLPQDDPEDTPEDGDEPETVREIDDEEDVVDDPVSTVPEQPAPVPGETPREKGLRLEVKRLKAQRRKDSVKEVVDSTVAEESVSDPYEELREKGYSDEEIQNMESAVDLIAKNKGYVRAEDTYRQNVQNTVDSFVDDHPEYKPENDPDDMRWTHFQAILKSGIYNLSGKTPRQLKSIFDKVDEDVRKELGEPIKLKSNKKQVAAQEHKVKVASHTGGGTKTTKSEEDKIDPSKPIGGVKFKGFGDDDFD